MPIDTGKTFDGGRAAAGLADEAPSRIVPDGRAEVWRTLRARPAASGRAPHGRAADRAGGARPVVMLLGQDTRAGPEPASAGHPEGPHTGAAGDPIGRGGELAALGAFLDQGASGGGALLIVGEPGAGKTRLLDAAAEMALAAGTRVLRAAGVASEADMPFAALHQVVLPLYEEFTRLAQPHRDALNVALGFGTGRAPDQMLVCTATLMVLRQAATARPVLLAVDDLPWLDRVSAGVLGFVARRLAGRPVGFLATCRPEEDSFFDPAGLPQLELAPLDERAAAELVGARFPGLAVRTRQRVLDEARGNPLALLELPALLAASPPAGPTRLPAAVPLSRRLQSMFAAGVTAQREGTRHLLLLMALDGTGDPRVLQVDAGGQDDLAAAERARLVNVDRRTRRLAFRHPLIRAAVVELSTGDECRRAHQQLAGLLADQPDRQAWHLAEATVAPDEHVAGLLERAAGRILARGDAAGAVTLLTRASQLSPRGGDRGRRLAVAACLEARMNGDLGTASRLLDEARLADPDSAGSLDAAIVTSYLLLSGDGDVDAAHRLLVGTVERRAGDGTADNRALEEALHALLRVCWLGGRAELWRPFHAVLARLAPNVPAPLDLASKIVADPVRTAAPALKQLDAALADLAQETDPVQIMRIADACGFVDRYGPCRAALWRVVRDGREGRTVGSAITALILLGFDHFRTGQWDLARQLSDEALTLSAPPSYQTLGAQLNLAVLAACRGEEDRTRQLADAMLTWASPRGICVAQWGACYARGLAALGRGDYEEAYRQAAAISPAGTFAPYVPYATWVMMDLVEAATRTGRTAEAAAHVTAMRTHEVPALSPRLALLAAGAAAIAAPDDQASGLFEAALALPGADRWPFDLARVQLAYGERLRRTRATTASRIHLTAALETFERLGARPWAARASNELRATGQTRFRPDPSACQQLTPQEREIAVLAAAGLTNKQIAGRLYLSHRTVGAHLHRVFGKLGITTRVALRDALAALSGG
jgi:DNA-binding CsgD family transcriptional regulator